MSIPPPSAPDIACIRSTTPPMCLTYIVVPLSRIRWSVPPTTCTASSTGLCKVSAAALATAATALVQTSNPHMHVPTLSQPRSETTTHAPHRPMHLKRARHANRPHTMRLPTIATLTPPPFPERPHLSVAEEAEIITRMLVAVVVGATIGVERRAASASAGVRTLTLVSLGSAIFSLTALHGLGGDPARMGAAISTGIGFLGSGAINGQIMGSRRQLVTAASIWIAAALGVAAAAGLFTLAISGAFVTIWILRWRLLFALASKLFRDTPFLGQPRTPPLSSADERWESEVKDDSEIKR